MFEIDDATCAKLERISAILALHNETREHITCGDWRFEERWPVEYREIMTLTQDLRRSKRTDLKTVGYQIQLFIQESAELDRMYRAGNAHERQLQRQAGLVALIAERAAAAAGRVPLLAQKY
ncbi:MULTISPECIES: hypothetical protein [Paenibacillus]|uniref:hypothetical protein n=1 Tax=Paenibacillus TaxID=44249 RepID=UPI000430FB69|nr:MULTISPECIES: hypothetical protein [Paenibacillus]CDN44445.1 hypothetical protein BN871_EV_00310 [Paenibacillus sp. P22]